MSVEPVDRKGGRVYRVRWRDEAGAHSRVIGRKRDAEAFDAELKRRRRLGGVVDLERGVQTLAAFAENEWWELYAVPHLAERTRASYASVWDLHILPHLGDYRLRDLTPQLIEKFVGQLRKAGTGDPTIYRALMVLQGVCRRAVEWGHLTTNPVSLVRKPTVRRIRQITPLTPTEVEHVRSSTASPQDSLIVAMLAYAGLRPQELLALTWYDITDTHILVDKATEPREGVKDTKTNKPRTVAIRTELRAVLKDYEAKHDHVITMQDGSPWNDNAWRRWSGRRWRPLMKELNMEMAPYDLRHTFVSQLIDEGQSIVEIARQAGHSPTMTLTVYGHIFDRRDAA